MKNGFQSRSLLSASVGDCTFLRNVTLTPFSNQLETFNAHSLIHDGFAKHGQIHLHLLGQLMHDVALRKSELQPKVGRVGSHNVISSV